MTDSPHAITDIDLQRLADGELSPAERNELLRAIDASPEAWRRCALAFLEVQALRDELGAIAAEAASPAAPGSDLPATPAPRWRIGWLALAASLLTAFAIGLATPSAWRERAAAPPQLAAEQEGGVGQAGGEAPSPTPQQPPEQAVAAAPQQRPDAPNADAVTFWTRDERGERQSLRTRLIDADELSRRYGVRFDSATPPGLHEEFEERGLRLKTRRRFAPLNTEDGRTLVVPVEDLQVTPLTYL